MADDPPTFEQLLKRRAGTDLRSIARYNDDQYHFVYLRSDVHEAYTEEELTTIFDEFRHADTREPRVEDRYHLGGLLATQRLFEQGIVCHVSGSTGRGTLVTLDAEAAPDTTELLHEVVEFLHGHSEYGASGSSVWRQ